MNPEIDERLIFTVSSSFIEIIIDWLNITAIREGYGETFNEGICYEFCAGIPFSGMVTGELFICMDGYTRALILPYIIKNLELKKTHDEVAKMAMRSFVSKIAEEFFEELKDITEVNVFDIRELNHKIIQLPGDELRKYSIIYFIRDDENRKYLGRIYLHLALEKD
jgi:hypothetical protein